MRCFGCGGVTSLASGERIGFRDTCAACGRDLHVCRNCAHHDPSAYNECREPNAERVGERDRSNRCEYFTPGEAAGARAGAERKPARASLDALFKPPKGRGGS
jgi:hypothetical protein